RASNAGAAAPRGVLGRSSKAQSYGELRLERFHRRDRLVGGKFSNLRIRPSDETDRGARASTGSSGGRGFREGKRRARGAGWQGFFVRASIADAGWFRQER